MSIKIRFSLKDALLLFFFYILLFQNALESVIPACVYIDEATGLFGIAVLALNVLHTGKLKMKKNTASIITALSVFFLAGFAGNIIYKYQPMQAVLIDIYTNFKFFLSIISGYVLFKICGDEDGLELLNRHARIMSLLLFILLLMDLTLHLFESPEYRYGIRVVKLFFFHPTYLAGAMVFLLSILLMFYRKGNAAYMFMSLAVLFFTLRAKALAAVVIYPVIIYFLVYYRKKLKLWHVIVIAAAAVFVAWGQISYYYIELPGESARAVLTRTSFKIMGDYFPIGTGFGTYASASATEYYSPIYFKYGLNHVWGLYEGSVTFGSDTFWPIIFGQTGFIGTVAFLIALTLLARRVFSVRKESLYAYAAIVFVFSYLMISSTSEPAFHNSLSVPLAVLCGCIIFLLEKNEDELLNISCDGIRKYGGGVENGE